MSFRDRARRIAQSLHALALGAGVLFTFAALYLGRILAGTSDYGPVTASVTHCKITGAGASAPAAGAGGKAAEAMSFADETIFAAGSCEGYVTAIRETSSTMMLIAISIIGASYVLSTLQPERSRVFMRANFGLATFFSICSVFIYYRIAFDAAEGLFRGLLPFTLASEQLASQAILVSLAFSILVSQAIFRSFDR